MLFFLFVFFFFFFYTLKCIGVFTYSSEEAVQSVKTSDGDFGQQGLHEPNHEKNCHRIFRRV